jgi:uncharacterized protein
MATRAHSAAGTRASASSPRAWRRGGIASLRYDKRGIGASRVDIPGGEASLTIDDFAGDAVAWGRQLRADARFGRLVLAGHSEGALIALMAAPQLKADGVVTIAGPGRRLQEFSESSSRRGSPRR